MRQGVNHQSLGANPKLLLELPDLTVLLLHLLPPCLQQLRVAIPTATATASSVSATDGSSGCPPVKLELKLRVVKGYTAYTHTELSA